MGNKSTKKKQKQQKGNKQNPEFIEYNICIVGFQKVGKTTLIKRLFENYQGNILDNSFSISHKNDNNQTICTKFIVTEINYLNDDYYESYSKTFYENNLKKYNMIVCLYDVTNSESFEYVTKYLNIIESLSKSSMFVKHPIEQMLNIQSKKIFLIGSKIDLGIDSSRCVTEQYGRLVSANCEIDSEFMEVSLVHKFDIDTFMDIFVKLLSRPTIRKI